MAKKALVVENIGIKFNLNKEKPASIREFFDRILHGRMKDEFWALKDVSFSLEQGDRMAILGLNGSGKSTLLKIIAGVFKPTEGTIRKNGKIVPLLELGAGFEKQYTGRENIYLYGAVLGYNRAYMDEHFDEIVEFSGLEQFIDVPLINYSSGMRSKLGFAIATVANPDILILDEVFSVGDVRFRRKSIKKIKSMMEDGTTALFVSHSIAQVKNICNRAMILEQGRMVAMGDVEEITELYEKMYGLEADKAARKERKKRKRERRRLRKQMKLEAAGGAVQTTEEEDGASQSSMEAAEGENAERLL